MNYYTSTIPPTLAEKLKEKGIHQLADSRMEGWLNSGDNITYAEVFDWLLMERRINILIEIKQDSGNYFIPKLAQNGIFTQINITPFGVIFWHEAADKAIEKALTLI